jgi:tRNA(fMet)-specific endonuclease VapC
VTYLLDTNAVIAILNDRPTIVRDRLKRAILEGSTICVSAVVVFELWYGVAKSSRPVENIKRLQDFLSKNVRVSPFDEAHAAVAGSCMQLWKSKGM